MSKEIDQIDKAIGNVQQVIDIVKKDSKGNNYTYADLTSVQNAVVKPFKDNGLSYSHILDGDNVICILFHESGQYLTSRYPIEATATKFMNINQSRGSAITYGRRYTLAAIVGIPQDDDDAKGSNFNLDEKQENQVRQKKEEEERINEGINNMMRDINGFTEEEQYKAYIFNEEKKKKIKWLKKHHSKKYKNLLDAMRECEKTLNVSPEYIWSF